MTTYVAIPDGDIDLDSPVNQPLMTAMRDNPIAIAEVDASVPASLRARALLGTLTTTSGGTQTLSGLDLTTYELLHIVVSSVSGTLASTLRLDGEVLGPVAGSGTDVFRGMFDLDLASGICLGAGAFDAAASPSSSITPRIIYTTYRNSSTSLVFTISSGTFDAGTIRVYGVK